MRTAARSPPSARGSLADRQGPAHAALVVAGHVADEDVLAGLEPEGVRRGGPGLLLGDLPHGPRLGGLAALDRERPGRLVGLDDDELVRRLSGVLRPHTDLPG